LPLRKKGKGDRPGVLRETIVNFTPTTPVEKGKKKKKRTKKTYSRAHQIRGDDEVHPKMKKKIWGEEKKGEKKERKKR